MECTHCFSRKHVLAMKHTCPNNSKCYAPRWKLQKNSFSTKATIDCIPNCTKKRNGRQKQFYFQRFTKTNCPFSLLGYLSNIFSNLNELYKLLQGLNKNILIIIYRVSTFINKHVIWSIHNVDTFISTCYYFIQNLNVTNPVVIRKMLNDGFKYRNRTYHLKII